MAREDTIPNRLRCTAPGCDQWLEARLINSSRIASIFIFRKTAALIVCPRCDSVADADSFSMWHELKNML